MRSATTLLIAVIAGVLACAKPAPPTGATGERIVTSTSSSASAALGASAAAKASAPTRIPDASVPPGFEWRTIRHETILATLAIPQGTAIAFVRGEYGLPLVTIDIDGRSVALQYDSGVGQLGVTLSKKPPTVYGMRTTKASVTNENVTGWYVDTHGRTRILGVAPGVKCSYEAVIETPVPTLERMFAVCSSLRTPELGPPRPATKEERVRSGMTDVPEGAWVDASARTTLMFAGAFTVRGRACPSFDTLRTTEAPEVAVDVQKRTRPAGDVWIRIPTETFQGDRFPGASVVVAPRAGRCCVVTFIPWITPPSARQLDDAAALCDTFRDTP